MALGNIPVLKRLVFLPLTVQIVCEIMMSSLRMSPTQKLFISAEWKQTRTV